MTTPLLTTKLHIPPPRPNLVPRPRLIERLNAGIHCKLILVSAPAGFGKTTLLSEWVAGNGRPVAWLSLDAGDNDLNRFLTYFIAALQTIKGNVGQGLLGALQSPGPVNVESVLTTLLNEIAGLPDSLILILDDYHFIEARSVHDTLTFLLRHLPPQMHLVIATREDPPLPLTRLRAQGQLTELRASDLRFIPAEAAQFLNQVMGLNLSAEDTAMLETRTEGWIAGLQLAALALRSLGAPQGTLSMQGHKDATSFIKSFTGSHHFILDYLVEQVLEQQSESVQAFLLRTSILDRLCGPLCDAVCSVGTAMPAPSTLGQETLEYLERANLFIVPLDNERRWYRYHHLFADLLRQRLRQQQPLLRSAASSTGDEGGSVAEYHRRASVWYEENDLELEAFHHAAAANDVERAERLIEGEGMPLHFRGAVVPVLNWLKSLPTTVLDARPTLWTTYASVLMVTGQHGVEQKLQAAEAVLVGSTTLQGTEPATTTDDKTRDLVGRIAALRATMAAIRATMAATQYQVETNIIQSRRALEYLHPDNLPFRTMAIWTLGVAYQDQGDRAAASRAYTEAISISQASGNTIINVAATTRLGGLQEAENQLYLAAQTYRHALQLFGDQPLPVAYEAHLGLARIFYEWNDLDAAQQHGQQSVQLARQIQDPDRFIPGEVFLAHLKLAQGNVTGAAATLAKVSQFVRQHNFAHRIPEVAAAQVVTFLCQGNLAAAVHLAQTHELPISQVRVYLAQGNASAALEALATLRQQAEAKGWKDERLKVMVLQAVAHHAAALRADSEIDKAVQVLSDVLALAAPGGFIRIFVDKGIPIARLLSKAAAQGIMPDYVDKLLAVFESEEQKSKDKSSLPSAQPLIEPLSERELQILRLIAQRLSNREISERLFLALSTVKTHNRNIFGKLQVHRRTEAVARARELGLL